MFHETLLLAQGGAGDNSGTFGIIGGLVVLGFGVLFIAVFARYATLWVQAKMTRASISLGNLVMMSFRKVNPTIIVRSRIMAVQAGLTRDYEISTRALEAHYLAGGNVPNHVVGFSRTRFKKMRINKRSSRRRSIYFS